MRVAYVLMMLASVYVIVVAVLYGLAAFVAWDRWWMRDIDEWTALGRIFLLVFFLGPVPMSINVVVKLLED